MPGVCKDEEVKQMGLFTDGFKELKKAGEPLFFVILEFLKLCLIY
jgi:hypothetical protein